ncbi:MAG: hypothetical protein MK212_18500 [Saprospiraceae bacterium]|nr:hypothetical protein [Saprospiraceae bacterium]
MKYKLKQDSLSYLIVYFHNGHCQKYFSIDWANKQFDQEVGYRNFEKMLNSQKFVRQWDWAYVCDKYSAVANHYYHHSNQTTRLDKEGYKKAKVNGGQRFNIAIIYNNEARRNGLEKNRNVYNVDVNMIPTYFNKKMVYQINIYTVGQNSKMVAWYRNGLYHKVGRASVG